MNPNINISFKITRTPLEQGHISELVQEYILLNFFCPMNGDYRSMIIEANHMLKQLIQEKIYLTTNYYDRIKFEKIKHFILIKNRSYYNFDWEVQLVYDEKEYRISPDKISIVET